MQYIQGYIPKHRCDIYKVIFLNIDVVYTGFCGIYIKYKNIYGYSVKVKAVT